jgi:hypothetical protein
MKAVSASEDVQALAFATQHAADLRFVALWNKCLAYDDVCWRADDTLHVFDRVRLICRDMSLKASAAKTVAAVERLARSDRRWRQRRRNGTARRGC